MNRRVWITFIVFCLLAASAWIANPLGEAPSLPAPELQGLLHAAIGLAALLFCLLPSSRRGSPPAPARSPARSLAQAAFTGILFFGLPTAILALSGAVNSISGTAVFAIVPIVVILTTTSTEAREPGEAEARGLLIPALTGAAGLYLLLSFNLSASPHSILLIAATAGAAILVGSSGVWLHRTLRSIRLPKAIPAICLSNAVFLLGISLATPSLWSPPGLSSTLSIPSLIDAAETLLLLWLLRSMPPIRLAARYLFIPLLTILESFLYIRPPLTLRILGGTALLAAGTALLLVHNPAAEDEQFLSLH